MSPRKALTGLMVVAVVAFIGAAFAAEQPAQPREVTLTGKVTAAPESAKGAYAATFETERTRRGQQVKVTLKVTNDDQGMKLAKEADGKTAEVKGTLSRKDDESWLTVKEFKLVEEAPAK